MSKALSANIHDPNHNADDYDIYFNGDILSGNGQHEHSANIHNPNHTADDYDIYFNGDHVTGTTSDYVQDGLIHEFTNMDSSVTIPEGQAIFNTPDRDFTIMACSLNKAQFFLSEENNNYKEFKTGITWQGKVSTITYYSDGSNNSNSTYVYTPNDLNEMKYVCVTKSGTVYSIYYNGSMVGQITKNTDPIALSGDQIVNKSGKSCPKMLIYNRALTAEEILQNYNAMVAEVG